MTKTHRPLLKIIDKPLIEKIITEAYKLLEKVGVLVENEDALQLLDGAGARIDHSKLKAFIKQDIAEKAMRTAPESITVYDRDGIPTLYLEDDQIHFE